MFNVRGSYEVFNIRGEQQKAAKTKMVIQVLLSQTAMEKLATLQV